MTEWT